MSHERRKPSTPIGRRTSKQALLEMALTDVLTGLPNRRALDMVLERAWHESKDDRAPLCVAMVDIDLFKTFNDRFGHSAGDACLKHVAEQLSSAVRDDDVVGRYGGEEFVVIFRDTNLSVAVEVAERMREAVAALDVQIPDNGTAAVSISVGVAQVRWEPDESIADAVNAADVALYAAKDSGRNRVAVPGGQESKVFRLGRATRTRLQFQYPQGSLVGRAVELSDACDLLEKDRIVTLTGPGGIGKTRLAQAIAERAEKRFRDGIFFFELSDIGEEGRLAPALAERLGISREDPRGATQALCAFFESHQALLVFDNCEHLVDACAQLVDSLQSQCLQLRILATSREPLNLPEETVLRLPALDIASATELFDVRARHALPAFRVDEHAPTVVEICRSIDCLPLAIELAAARVRMMTPEDILAGLGDRFSLLVGGARTKSSRHQTLHALFDWSYRLLPVHEQRAFRRLAVFSGGCVLESAAGVCSGELETHAFFDVMTQLVDKSLVIAKPRPAGPLRYDLLESASAYGLEKLHESAEFDPTAARHAEHYNRLAGQAAAEWSSAPSERWLSTIAPELENVRAALRWSLDAGNERWIGAQLVCASAPLFYELGLSAEGGRRLIDLISSGALPSDLQAAAHLWAARLLADVASGDSIQYARRGAELAREEGQTKAVAQGLLLEAKGLMLGLADREQIVRLLEEAIDLFRRIEEPFGRADALAALGTMRSFNGDFDKALECYDEALQVFRLLGKTNNLGRALGNVGAIYETRGDVEQAIAYFHESILQFERTGNRPMMAWIEKNLAETELLRGNLDAAATWIVRAIAGTSLMGYDWLLALDFTQAARVAFARGNHGTAAELAGFADAMLERQGQPRQPRSEETYRQFMADLRTAFGLESFDWHYKRGQALSLAEARAKL